MAPEPVPAYTGFRSGRIGRAYNEAAFRHFLAVDRRRAERAKRALLLVLLAVRPPSGRSETLADTTAAALFTSLGECVREIDFVGWYRERRVAGAVLAQGAGPAVDGRHQLTERLTRVLRRRLSPDEFLNLRVRIIRLRGPIHV